jgi:hypothetical protein
VNEEGAPVFPNQKEIEGYILYGMQYDVDSSRLVSLCINKNIGRVPVSQQGVDEYFTYEICRINIDETNPNFVQMEMMSPVLLLDSTNIPIVDKYSQSPLVLGFTGVSCMISKFD